jgi:hypothetical protein
MFMLRLVQIRCARQTYTSLLSSPPINADGSHHTFTSSPWKDVDDGVQYEVHISGVLADASSFITVHMKPAASDPLAALGVLAKAVARLPLVPAVDQPREAAKMMCMQVSAWA